MLEVDRLVAALNAGGVEYLVIGGMAVAAHGFVRATKDLDIVPSPEQANLARLATVLKDLGATNFGAGDFDADEFPFDPLDPAQLAAGGNFVLATRVGRLDIMQWVPGIDADRAYEHLSGGTIDGEIAGTRVRICSRDDLVAMKRASGRPQDLEDLRQLGA